MAKLTCALAYLCCLLPLALGSTVRHTKVRIENKSSMHLSAVKVNHAYGTIFGQRNTEEHTWTNVAPGATTEASMEVEYLTGHMGADWWQVGWTVLGEPMTNGASIGKIKFRTTKPANAQGLVDEFMTGLGGELLFQVNRVLSDPIAKAGMQWATVLKMAAGTIKPSNIFFQFAKAAAGVIMAKPKEAGNKNLVGFKQCTLTRGDQDDIVDIRIYDKEELQISPADSSNCDTVWKLVTVPWNPNGLMKREAVATPFKA
jgi:hypothetical protein